MTTESPTELEAPPTTRRSGAAVIACVALAAASLALPAALSFDPWAWLVWGREVGRLALDTTGGPSWKPLPVLVTTVLAPLGDLAIPAWIVLARAGALLAVLAAYRLAARSAGVAAGVVAAVLLILTPDGDPRFLRLVGEAHVDPVSVGLVLYAAESHLDRRPVRALALGWGLALLRPEAWPFLGLYALWLWFRRPDQRLLAATSLVTIPVLWFGGDWWGSGDFWHGADAAQVSAGTAIGDRFVDAVRVAASMVVAPAWVAVVAAVVSARRQGERALLVLAGGGLAWTLLVIAMAVTLGYAALSRFFLPAAGVACVLAGVGVVRGLAALRSRALLPAVLAATVGITLTVPRAAGVIPVLEAVGERGHLEVDLDRVIDEAGASALTACGEVAVEGSGLLRTAVAWKLDVKMRLNPLQLSDGSGSLLLRDGGRRDRIVSASPHAAELARADDWVAHAVRCPSALPDS